MRILGICDGHDSGACLSKNGRIITAVSSERITGQKRQPGFPGKAIYQCLNQAGISASQIDAVAVSEVAGRAAHRLFDRRYRQTDPNLPMLRGPNIASMKIQNLIAGNPTFSSIDKALSKTILRKRLQTHGIYSPLFMVDHHKAHAVSAAYGSGFEEGLVITMDAFGDGQSCTTWNWKDGELELLSSLPYPHSPALVYGLVTSFLGFSEGDEGKVAGLAAKGDPGKTADWFDSLFRFKGNSFELGRVPCFSEMELALSGVSTEDIAAGLQNCVEGITKRYVLGWAKVTGAKRLCLAGGLFANVKLNQELAECSDFKDVYIFPHMGDGGLCIGAAWELCPPEKPAPFDEFTGPEPAYSQTEASDIGNAQVTKLDSKTASLVAELLADGKPVGIITGQMEFGPRALGNRSLLFPADDPKLADQISNVLERPKIMPFAPVVREEDYCSVAQTPAWAAFYSMTITAEAKVGIADKYSVAVHNDGSMRVQIVRPGSLLHDILTAYSRHKRPAMIINTSFNMHTEPIINTAKRALTIYNAVPLAALVLGDKYIERR